MSKFVIDKELELAIYDSTFISLRDHKLQNY